MKLGAYKIGDPALMVGVELGKYNTVDLNGNPPFVWMDTLTSAYGEITSIETLHDYGHQAGMSEEQVTIEIQALYDSIGYASLSTVEKVIAAKRNIGVFADRSTTLGGDEFVLQSYQDWLSESDLSQFLPPFVSWASDLLIMPSSEKTITIYGHYFTRFTSIDFEDDQGTVFDGYVKEVLEVNAEFLVITIVTGANEGSFKMKLKNGIFTQDGTVLTLNVKTIPTGPEKHLRISSSRGDNYDAVAYSSSGNSDEAFDGNSGTRHRSVQYYEAGHWIALISATPVMVTRWALHVSDNTKNFELQVSNDSTNGSDGTWTTIDSITNLKQRNYQDVEYLDSYTAVRVLWLDTPFRAECRDAYIVVRQ